VGGHLLCANRIDGGDRRRHRFGRQHACQGTPLRRRRKRGAYDNAIGRSRGGRTTKVHALTDSEGGPLALTLTPGNTHDLTGGPDLLAITGAPRRLLADRAYDARSLRDWLVAQGCEAVIPPNPTRKNPHTYAAEAYKQGNGIERFFCRLKDFRRIHTRYDKRADIFLSALLIVAAIIWWAN
jgi:transposase